MAVGEQQGDLQVAGLVGVQTGERDCGFREAARLVVREREVATNGGVPRQEDQRLLVLDDRLVVGAGERERRAVIGTHAGIRRHRGDALAERGDRGVGPAGGVLLRGARAGLGKVLRARGRRPERDQRPQCRDERAHARLRRSNHVVILPVRLYRTPRPQPPRAGRFWHNERSVS